MITEHLKKDLERDMFYFSIEQIKAYLSRVNGLVTIISDATTVNIRLHTPILTDEILTATTQAPTTSRNDISLQEAPPRSPMPFSDNKTGNEGRTVIQGFARKNSEKASVTASVEANVEQPTPPSNTKVCQWCDEYFVYSIHNQKFCCEDCRIAAYQDRTGKVLVKGKKK